MLICLRIVYGCFQDIVAEWRSSNRDHRTHRVFAIWIFIDEVCRPLLWTKGYDILNALAIFLQKRDIHNSRYSLEEFSDSLNDLVLKFLLPGLRVECPLPARTICGQTILAPDENLPLGIWVPGTEFRDGQQSWFLPKAQLLFTGTGLIDHHLFPA